MTFGFPPLPRRGTSDFPPEVAFVVWSSLLGTLVTRNFSGIGVGNATCLWKSTVSLLKAVHPRASEAEFSKSQFAEVQAKCVKECILSHYFRFLHLCPAKNCPFIPTVPSNLPSRPADIPPLNFS